MEVVQSINLIATNQNVRNGRAHIIGTSITVADVAIVKIYHDQDVDGLALWFDLTLPQVYSALAYYYDHKEEVDEEIRSQIQTAEELREKRLGSQNSLLPG